MQKQVPKQIPLIHESEHGLLCTHLHNNWDLPEEESPLVIRSKTLQHLEGTTVLASLA